MRRALSKENLCTCPAVPVLPGCYRGCSGVCTRSVQASLLHRRGRKKNFCDTKHMMQRVRYVLASVIRDSQMRTACAYQRFWEIKHVMQGAGWNLE